MQLLTSSVVKFGRKQRFNETLLGMVLQNTGSNFFLNEVTSSLIFKIKWLVDTQSLLVEKLVGHICNR